MSDFIRRAIVLAGAERDSRIVVRSIESVFGDSPGGEIGSLAASRRHRSGQFFLWLYVMVLCLSDHFRVLYLLFYILFLGK